MADYIHHKKSLGFFHPILEIYDSWIPIFQ